MSGQVTQQVILSRQDESERVIFTGPLGFTIYATAKGVSFAGASTNFDPAQLSEVIDVLRWCRKISKELAAGRGIIPQAELIGVIKLKERKVGKVWVAHFTGYEREEIHSPSKETAVKGLRALWSKLNS